MGFLKDLGSFIGDVTGTVVGGAVKAVGEITDSDFIKEVGDGVEKASKFAGDTLGQVASGAWDVGAGVFTQDNRQLDEGFGDLGEAIGRTGKGVVDTVSSVIDHGANIVDGISSGNDGQLVDGLKGIGKTVAVGALAIGAIDIVDGMDGTPEVAADTHEPAETPPGVNHVDPHQVSGYVRADGTVVESYYRDGDGNTSVNLTKEEGGGYLRTHPDGNPLNNFRA